MFRAGKFREWKLRDFCSYVSAQYYFLQKFHEERPELRLSVISDECPDAVSTSKKDEDR